MQKPPPSQNLDLLKMSRTSSKKSSSLSGGLMLIYHGTFSVKRFPQKNYRVLKGGCSRGGGNWGTLRIPREDWGTLGNIRED